MNKNNDFLNNNEFNDQCSFFKIESDFNFFDILTAA